MMTISPAVSLRGARRPIACHKPSLRPRANGGLPGPPVDMIGKGGMAGIFSTLIGGNHAR